MTMKVLQSGRYYTDNLKKALSPHGITTESRGYKLRESSNHTLDVKCVRFGFFGCERPEMYAGMMPNANSECLYSFLRARDGPPSRLDADVTYASARRSIHANHIAHDLGNESLSDPEDDDGQGRNAAKSKRKSDYLNRPSGDLCGLCALKVQEKGIFKCTYRNNKNALFLKIPSSTKIKHLRERMPDADLKEVGRRRGETPFGAQSHSAYV